ncbi:MAG TPA: hypothetical protein VL899_18120 [Alphaproteobacteria bacterium]|nr:hypothetical protein [Alphaproteobacteria bacterium]
MRIMLIVVAALLVIIGIGLAILASVDIPAPSGEVEKAIPADRLPH